MYYIMTSFYREFECIADACINTCCKGWQIIIDRETYEKMVEKENELGIAVGEWLAEEDGKMVVQRVERRCPMLNENNLCKVVLKLGPEYLSEVCTQFPRRTREYGPIMEASLHTSCAAVVEYLMDETEIEFLYAEDDEASDNKEAAQVDMNLYFYESNVRRYCIDVLQGHRDVPLEARVFAVFKILQKAIAGWKHKQTDFDTLKAEMDACISEDALQSLSAEISQTVKETDRYHFIRRIILLHREIIEDYDERMMEGLEQAADYFSESSYETYEKDLAAFRKACRQYDNFYTNYWVWQIFCELVEAPDYQKVEENFLCIMTEFCMFQALALAMFARNSRLDRKNYIYMISYMGKLMQHNSTYREFVLNKWKQDNAASSAGLMLAFLG